MCVVADVLLRPCPPEPAQWRLRVRDAQVLGYMVVLGPGGEVALDVPAGRASCPWRVLLRRFDYGGRDARGEQRETTKHGESNACHCPTSSESVIGSHRQRGELQWILRAPPQ